MNNKKEYTPKQILALAAAIQEEEAAIDWLSLNRHELYLIYRTIVLSNSASCEELKASGFSVEYMFAIAFQEDFQTSIDYFIRNEELVWAAVVDACRDNLSAMEWLEKKHPPYKVLAESILNFYKWRRTRRGRAAI